MTRVALAALLVLAGALAVAAPRQDGGAAASDEALLRELRRAEDDALAPALDAGYERFLERMDAFELDSAQRLARALHLRAAAPWSAENLALVLGRRGATDAAIAVLDEQIDRLPTGADRARLVHTRGLIRLGAGLDAAAAADLGRAWAHGSTSGGLVLARLALADGRTERARTLSRALLAEDPATPWVARIWGLSMLRPAPDSRR